MVIQDFSSPVTSVNLKKKKKKLRFFIPACSAKIHFNMCHDINETGKCCHSCLEWSLSHPELDAKSVENAGSWLSS